MEQRAVRFPRPAERGEMDTVKLRSYLAAAAMKLGLEAARLRNKETYTPKKYRGPKEEA